MMGKVPLFKMLAYAFGPLILSLLFITLSSHVLTLNEVFVLDFARWVGMIWTAVNILLGVQETHSYDTRDAIKSILVTLVFMVVIAIVLIIVIIMGEQLFQFFEAIIKEVIRNASA